jgi:glycosyl hydrolase family 16
MSPVPSVEPAPLRPRPDADAGIPSAASSRSGSRHAGAPSRRGSRHAGGPSPRGSRHVSVRKFRPWRVTLVLATAALSAGALVAAHNVEGRDLSAAKTNPVRSAHSLGRTSALSDAASPSPRVGRVPVVHEDRRTPAVHKDHKTPAPQSSASPHPVQSRPGLSGPSGVPVPTGNLPGWQLTYSQDFSGTSLPPGWGAYSGEPGGDPYGYWDSANVSVSNGELHLSTTPNDDPQSSNTASTGGVAFSGNPQEYGMYLVRMRGDYEPGLQISDIALLWPADGNSWPPEMDFFEDEGGSRSGFTASLHPGPDGDDCCVVRNTLANAATQWHTYGIIWTPTSITYTIDGRAWGVVQSSQVSGPGEWPSIPMNLDLQSQNLGPAQPNGSIETMTVAWVAEYAPSS